MNRAAFSICTAVLLLASLADIFAAEKTTTTPTPSQAKSKENEPDWNLSREAFLEEVLIGIGCARTPRFDDYTTGSYHIGLLDLVAGVRKMHGQRTGTRRLVGLMAYGPTGGLWEYNVIGIVAIGDGLPFLCLNRVCMAHARITLKQTKIMDRKEVLAILAAFDSIKLLKRGDPLKKGRDELFFISIDWCSGKERIFWAKDTEMTDADKVGELEKQLQLLSDAANTTYMHNPPDGMPFRK